MTRGRGRQLVHGRPGWSAPYGTVGHQRSARTTAVNAAVMTVAVALTLFVSGCGISGSAADRRADTVAREASAAMQSGPHQETALEATQSVTGTAINSKIEVVQASGDYLDGTMVLRISITSPGEGFGSPASSATRCYRYRLDAGVSEPHRQPCPSSPPITLAHGPSLPADAVQQIHTTLSRLNDPAGLTADIAQASVRQALPPIGFSVRATRKQGDLGVSVLASDGRCLLARRLHNPATGSPIIEVWIVPPSVAPTSEFTCLAGAAAQGAYQHSPPTPDS